MQAHGWRTASRARRHQRKDGGAAWFRHHTAAGPAHERRVFSIQTRPQRI